MLFHVLSHTLSLCARFYSVTQSFMCRTRFHSHSLLSTKRTDENEAKEIMISILYWFYLNKLSHRFLVDNRKTLNDAKKDNVHATAPHRGIPRAYIHFAYGTFIRRDVIFYSEAPASENATALTVLRGAAAATAAVEAAEASHNQIVILTVRLRQNDLFASYDYIHDT